MLVFLSCARNNDFFLNAAEEAKQLVEERIRPHIELFHPPSVGITGTNSVVGNVARILFADLTLIDITPERDHDGNFVYNAGVMIEFGMIFGQDLRFSASIGGGSYLSVEKPNFKVFSNNAISRRDLTPIFNNTDIHPYKPNEEGKKELIKLMFDSITDAIGKKIDRQPIIPNIQYPFSLNPM